MTRAMLTPPQPDLKSIMTIPDLSMILEFPDQDLEFDNQYAENWVQTRREQVAYHKARELPLHEHVIDEALFDMQNGKYYMRELGFWEDAFSGVLIHHKLTATTFTYDRVTADYEFVNVSDCPYSPVLVLRDPLIRVHVNNTVNIPSPPPTGYSLRFPPQILPPFHWTSRYRSAIKSRQVPLTTENAPPTSYLCTTMPLIYLNYKRDWSAPKVHSEDK